jgi:hypothetical protein
MDTPLFVGPAGVGARVRLYCTRKLRAMLGLCRIERTRLPNVLWQRFLWTKAFAPNSTGRIRLGASTRCLP